MAKKMNPLVVSASLRNDGKVSSDLILQCENEDRGIGSLYDL